MLEHTVELIETAESMIILCALFIICTYTYGHLINFCYEHINYSSFKDHELVQNMMFSKHIFKEIFHCILCFSLKLRCMLSLLLHFNKVTFYS